MYQKPFGNNTLFTPRIFTFNCEFCLDEIKRENCISDGKYCPFRPKFHREGPKGEEKLDISDKDLILQAVRDKCVYKLTSEMDSTQNFKYWFNYMMVMSEITTLR
jgi:hypothetical protein